MTIVSCTVTQELTTEQIIGEYQWNGVYGIGSTIELKKDKTFEYHWQAGLSSGTTLGIWKKKGNKIILNSNKQPSQKETEDFAINRTDSEYSDSISIKVVDTEAEPIPFANCGLKTDTITLIGVSTDFKGEAKLPKLKSDSLIISYIGYKTIRYKLDSSISRYEFLMKETYSYYEYFSDKKLKYRQGRLYDSSIKKGKYVKKNYYEPAPRDL